MSDYPRLDENGVTRLVEGLAEKIKANENPLFIDSSGYVSIDYDKVEDRRE